jgi:hypothetical protein
LSAVDRDALSGWGAIVHVMYALTVVCVFNFSIAQKILWLLKYSKEDKTNVLFSIDKLLNIRYRFTISLILFLFYLLYNPVHTFIKTTTVSTFLHTSSTLDRLTHSNLGYDNCDLLCCANLADLISLLASLHLSSLACLQILTVLRSSDST